MTKIKLQEHKKLEKHFQQKKDDKINILTSISAQSSSSMRWGREIKGVGTAVFGALFWCECELPPVINFTSILCQFPFTKNYKAKLQSQTAAKLHEHKSFEKPFHTKKLLL